MVVAMETYASDSSTETSDDFQLNFSSLYGTVDNASSLSSGFLSNCNFDNPLFNCTLEDYLTYRLGPQRLALNLAISITVLYILIGITGIVGNVSVCVVIIKNSSMHTATNYYLFSLAISDLMLLLLGLPNDISVYWHQYPYSMGIVFCKARALLSEAASYVSVLTIVAFSTERYLAICHPLHLYTMSGLQRAVRIIAALWIISLVFAAPLALQTTIHYLQYPPHSNNTALESAFCGMLDLQPYGLPLMEVSSILFFLLPAFVILVLYCRMGLKIRARSRNHLGKGLKGSVHGETRQAQSRKAIIRMLAAVVIAFFVCWAPFHAQRLIYSIGHQWPYFSDINEWMFSIAGWLYYVSSTVNPILYNVMSNRYRVAFRETLCCRRRHSNSLGLSRDQSSFRETTIATSGEGAHLVRVRSVTAESLHRSNTAGKLSRHSTMSSTLSKEYTSLKPRWGESKWGGNVDANFGAKIRTTNQSLIKGKFINLTSQDKEYDRDGASYKRKEITFEKETNNLLNSDRDDYEVGDMKIIKNSLNPDGSKDRRLSDSRSDSQLMTANRRSCLNADYLLKPDNYDKTSYTDFLDAKQDLVVVYGKNPSNGIKSIYSSNNNKNLPYTSNLIKQNLTGSTEELYDADTKDTSETCI